MFNKKKFLTRSVSIGNVAIGADNPIRIQSMTNTKTEDVENTVNQIIRLQDHGCEIARVTVQGKQQAYALEHIKNSLIRKGYNIPLVADIHFYPPAAFIAADFVDKVRINPGNFAEKRAVFKEQNLSNEDYQSELAKIEKKLLLLIDKLKKNKVALRIGVNHGSLSDRIMTKYGNTVKAMVVSAVEYTKICRKYNFHDIVFSMKSSSPFVMIEAYRALVDEMLLLGWDYPLHLGVTEAGDKEDGIIKSSVGIGALLLDGIGDTIRVSLTEDPHKEIEPATKLVNLSENRVSNKNQCLNNSQDKKIKTHLAIRLNNETLSDKQIELIDIFYTKSIDDELLKKLKKLKKTIISKNDIDGGIKIYSLDDLPLDAKEYVLEITSNDDFEKIKKLKPNFILFTPENSYIDNTRALSHFLSENNLDIPLILNLKYDQSLDDVKILASSEIGLILYEKLINAIIIDSRFDNLDLSLNILQACNLKRFKTEFISCPGCGRTLFDIQSAVKKIKEKTSHLPDVKIAIMGCIVNGPGEMQDADFGYVGSATGKIDLYVNKICIEKNIDEANAVEKLISLIKQNNRWKDKALQP